MNPSGCQDLPCFLRTLVGEQSCALILRRVGEEVLLPLEQNGQHRVVYFLGGWAEIQGASEQGAAPLYGPGYLAGLDHMFGLPAPQGLWTLTSVEVCTVPSQSFERWLKQDPPRAWALLKHQTAVNSGQRFLLGLRGLNAPQRIRRFLEAGRELPFDSIAEAQRLPRQVLARILNMRPETLSRTLHQMDREGSLPIDFSLRRTPAGTLAALNPDEES